MTIAAIMSIVAATNALLFPGQPWYSSVPMQTSKTRPGRRRYRSAIKEGNYPM
jgi:hypothetical protein